MRASIALMHMMFERDYTASVDHDSDTPFNTDMLVGALRGLEKRELSFTQFVAMHYLAGRERAAIGEVADAIDRSRAATSRLIDDLVRAGLVVRELSEEDRRVKRVRLTAAAKGFLAALHRAHHDKPRTRHTH